MSTDDNEGKVAPLKATTLAEWLAAEVTSVEDGSRKLGASLASKLDGHQLAALGATTLVVRLLRGDDPETAEYVWALDGETLDLYSLLQADAATRELHLPRYWVATGKLFGYTEEDVATFTSWIEQVPCPCPCVQCRPDLFAHT
jgi:hypothetical protein